MREEFDRLRSDQKMRAAFVFLLTILLLPAFWPSNLNGSAIQVRVRRIEVRGNHNTRDKFIRREMLLAEGDVLRPILLQESVRRISQLGLFDRVEAKIVPVPGTDQADIVIEVVEKKLNEVRGGLGFGQQEGLSGNIEFLTRNLLSSGVILHLLLEKGPHVSAYSFELIKPYFLDSRIAVGFSLYADRSDYLNYLVRQDIRGGSISATIPLPEDFHALIGFQKQYRDLPSDELSSLPVSEKTTGTEHRLIIQAVKKKEDSGSGSSEQNEYRFSFLLAGGPFGGEANYIKPAGKLIVFLPSFQQADQFVIQIQAGYAAGYSNKKLPVFERFFLGGLDTLRGYETGQVGPVQLVEVSSQTKNVVIGGNKFALFNLEYAYSLGRGVEIVPFLDFGNAFAPGKRLNLSDMHSSAGVELRIMIPWLHVPLRFIQAWNFNREELDFLPDRTRSRPSMFRISLGKPF